MSEPESQAINPHPDDGSARQFDGGLPSELAVFEARLSGLSPRDNRLDRERLMFLAGRASVIENDASLIEPVDRQSIRWNWRLTCGAMATTAAALLVVIALQHSRIASLELAAGARTGDAINDAVRESSVEPQVADREPVALRKSDGLAVGKVHFGEIDQWLAESRPARSAVEPNDGDELQEGQRPIILTPSSWRRVIELEHAVDPLNRQTYQNSNHAGVS